LRCTGIVGRGESSRPAIPKPAGLQDSTPPTPSTGRNPMSPREKKSAEISLAGGDAVKHLLLGTVFSLWDIVNNLTRLKPTKRERYRVTIFGSARAKPGTFAYEEVKRLATALAGMDCDIVTGGGPGLMQAANEGAHAANAPERNRSVG